MIKVFFLVVSFNFLYGEDLNIVVDVSEQKLYLLRGEEVLKIYDISTSKYGIGNESDSYKTPLGKHFINDKIGENSVEGSVFKHIKNTDKITEIYREKPNEKPNKDDDFIITRIMWLKGEEEGKNLGGNVDSYDRHIYIHGTHEEWLIGEPASKGCIRMKNKDIIELFDMVELGTKVYIRN